MAAEAGVPLASTTYYFASKEALVREAFALTIERSLALVAEHAARTEGTAIDRLVALADAQLRGADAPLAAQFELMLEAGRRPELRDLAEHWDTTYREALADLVGDELDVDVAGYLLDGALIGQLAFPTDGFRRGPPRHLLVPPSTPVRRHRIRAARPRILSRMVDRVLFRAASGSRCRACAWRTRCARLDPCQRARGWRDHRAARDIYCVAIAGPLGRRVRIASCVSAIRGELAAVRARPARRSSVSLR